MLLCSVTPIVPLPAGMVALDQRGMAWLEPSTKEQVWVLPIYLVAMHAGFQARRKCATLCGTLCFIGNMVHKRVKGPVMLCAWC